MRYPPPTMFAVIRTGGKQYLVTEGDVVRVEKLPGEKGTKVAFETLMVSNEDGSGLKLGTPSLGEIVTGEIVETDRDEKISVVKYKAKSRYKRRVGHRQWYTKVKIAKV